MTTLLSVVTEIWNQITGSGGLLATISSNALLLIPLAASFAGLVIGLTMKLMGIRRKRR